jgi:hypothetical protein
MIRRKMNGANKKDGIIMQKKKMQKKVKKGRFDENNVEIATKNLSHDGMD